MSDDEKRVPVAFYRTAAGNEPVREWLKDQPAADRKVIGIDIKTVEYGWPIGMPVCRPIASHKGMWEVRSSLSGRRIARVLFCISDSTLVLLHGFIKKSRQTPKTDLDLAARRMKEVTK